MTKEAAKLREQSSEELQALLRDTGQEIFKYRNALANNDKDVTPAFIRTRKKQVARIKTIQSERGEK